MNNNSLKIILGCLIPLLLLIGILIFGGVNLGVDYTSSNVISFRLTEDRPVHEVKASLSELKTYSRIDVYQDNKYNVFYQNVDLEELSALKSQIEEKLGEIKDFQVFVYNPTTLVLIAGRVFYGIYASVLIYLVLIAYLLRGKGLSREKLIWLLVGDLLLFAALALTIFGLLNLNGYLNQKITPHTINYGLAILLYTVMINLLITKGFNLRPNSDMSAEWSQTANLLLQKELRYFLTLGLILLSTLAISSNYLLLIPVFVVSTLYSILLYVYFKPILLNWLYTGGTNFKLFSKNKILGKEW